MHLEKQFTYSLLTLETLILLGLFFACHLPLQIFQITECSYEDEGWYNWRTWTLQGELCPKLPDCPVRVFTRLLHEVYIPLKLEVYLYCNTNF